MLTTRLVTFFITESPAVADTSFPNLITKQSNFFTLLSNSVSCVVPPSQNVRVLGETKWVGEEDMLRVEEELEGAML
jgi:hypothetical protein